MHTTALAVAAAHAARRGDRAAVERLLSMAGGEALTFADADTGGRSMWDRLKDRILGHRAQTAEERHRAEHERQAADFDRITVDGTVVSADLRAFYFGEPIYLFSTNVHWIRYERAEAGKPSHTYLLFKNGQEYIYDAVPWPVILREIQTDSPGRGVWGWFREGTPPYRSLYNGRKGKVYSLSAKERRPTVAHVVTWGAKKA